MTSSLIRGRPRRARAHISARVVHALLGALIGVVWLVLPGTAAGGAVAGGPHRPMAGALGHRDDRGTHTADLVLPMIAVVAAGALASFGFWRRRRRTSGRTTPGGAPVTGGEPPDEELDARAREALVRADGWVRVSREELGFAEARFENVENDERFEDGPPEEIEDARRALREAETELAAAFRIRRRYEHGVPEEDAARRHALAGIVGRCEEAGRLLDVQAAAFDTLRGLEEGPRGGLGAALTVAEARFRGLTARTAEADATLRDLGDRYAAPASSTVVGNVEQAKDRLVFATTRLNLARQAADAGEFGRAASRLRAAEGAIAQAGVLIDGVERLRRDLATAAELVPAALTGAEAEIAGARRALAGETAAHPDVTPGELRARTGHADVVLAGVRQEVASGRPYDPLGLLRRIVRAVAPLAAGRAGVLPAAAAVCARAAVAGADDVVATHGAVVGCAARTRLAEARRLEHAEDPADLVTADTLAEEARALADQDTRLHGHPPEPTPDLTAASLGALHPTPHSYGGPRTSTRRREPDEPG
ncbi:hypothetical protein [Streptomyces sp. NPDC057412]|uniref:hypothetical protein n=1 Tax=Streptomyces sp. NPDC057412 TaxID=3346123 RepID=UPI0036B8A388